MGIVNRSLDTSEQKFIVDATFRDTTTGQSAFAICRVPFAAQLVQGHAMAIGISGTPASQLKVHRFIVGSGYTNFVVGGACTHSAAFGTSGFQTFSLPASGSSLLDLTAGDVLAIDTSGTNAAAKVLSVSFVLQATQDIKSFA